MTSDSSLKSNIKCHCLTVKLTLFLIAFFSFVSHFAFPYSAMYYTPALRLNKIVFVAFMMLWVKHIDCQFFFTKTLIYTQKKSNFETKLPNLFLKQKVIPLQRF